MIDKVTGIDYDARREAAKQYTDAEVVARRAVPKYSATSPYVEWVEQVRDARPDTTNTENPTYFNAHCEKELAADVNQTKKSGGILAGIADLQTNDVNVAERVGFELAVRSIYILAGRYLGPNHEVMKLIRNMKA